MEGRSRLKTMISGDNHRDHRSTGIKRCVDKNGGKWVKIFFSNEANENKFWDSCFKTFESDPRTFYLSFPYSIDESNDLDRE